MLASVLENGLASNTFPVTHGTKQGCVLAPLLFSIFFSVMLYVAYKDCDIGIPLAFRTDRGLFDLRKLQAKTRVSHTMLRELLFV